MKERIITIIVCLVFLAKGFSQMPSPKEIIQKANDKVLGKYSQAEIKMTIIRPDWKREMIMKSWSSGQKYSLILITSPARDKGTSFLKIDKEMWDWRPSIERVIKMPPSMMSQSWMGSDFTNDDLANTSSKIDDYTHEILGEEIIEGRKTWILELTPKEGTAIVWGKIKIWIDKEEYIQMKTEFYDEDEYLIQINTAKKIKKIGDKMLPSVIEVIPAEEKGHKTKIEYVSLSFDEPISDTFFSIRNMKRLR
ncbi:outer membrane lipoprotein-sorting protein [Aquimarina sp. BL5]|uniref:outer membrane lipoprotein-sorting protein n=1 Tax=Aquimarina sp. BL5 TaxID=1714860 RepID=UPI000E4BB438|nr:outer membrane lipoprotein-sorting protein [Aquimarina sp. BL5]AXT51934.1 outer membrane lipoprotein-sorting protein [Aquimarina sp. BL5]RKM93422.1 outer membrane lipoprotein-sorting protein [Aquimarina sp. BL5]